MMFALWFVEAVVVATETAAKGQWKDTVGPDGRKGQQLEMQAPTVTEEERFGSNLPEQHECNGCLAVMYQLNKTLDAASTPGKRLKSWQYVDAFDQTCRDKFEGYGVTSIKGVNTLTGPGIEAQTTGMASIQMGGDKWKSFLASLCNLIISKVGDDETYDLYFTGQLSTQTCYGPELSYCTERTKKTSKPKKDKEQKTKKGEKKKKSPTVVATKKTFAQFLQDQEIADGVKQGQYSKPRSTAEWRELVKSLAEKTMQRNEL
eukprot:GEMP01056199.1.p1 GENE.GEMP01056199.1~~GEMP01056199.1.p1  ORF type:complete len:261 (-),score=82.54 GEMP01056199.1:606-1388(-)